MFEGALAKHRFIYFLKKIRSKKITSIKVHFTGTGIHYSQNVTYIHRISACDRIKQRLP